MTTKERFGDYPNVGHYTDGCDEVYGIFEAGAKNAVIEFRFWDDGDGVKRREIEKKARLFAAAPELLDALMLAENLMEQTWCTKEDQGEIRRSIRAAIDSATRCKSQLSELPIEGVQRMRINVVETFGGCPECCRNDGVLNVGRCQWFICRTHRTRWCAGASLFRSWKDESDDVWRADWAELRKFEEVTPIYGVSVTLTHAARDAMRHVLEHFLPDESVDYECSDDAAKTEHVFHQLIELKHWLERFAGGGDV